MLKYSSKKSVLFLFAIFSIKISAQEDLNSLQLLSKADMLLFNTQKVKAAHIYNQLLKRDSLNKYINFQLGLCYSGNNANHLQKINHFLKGLNISIDSLGRRPTFVYENNSYVLNSNIDSSFCGSYNLPNESFNFDTKKLYGNICFSGDNKTMVFVNASDSKNTIHHSKFDGKSWSLPTDITTQIGSMGDCFPSSVSFDGKRIYFTRYDGFDSEILVSIFDGKGWSALKKLNGNINTKYWDAHACESSDGLVLYFASNRPGGFGGMDIYYSIRSNNDWGRAFNVGQRINTFLEEDYPIIADEDHCIIYCSQGPKKGKDKLELYYAQAISVNNWKEPVELRYPWNTSDDDLSYTPMIESSRHFFYRNILSEGVSLVSKSIIVKANIQLKASNSKTNKKKVVVSSIVPKKETVSFGSDNSGLVEFQLKEGLYKLEMTSQGFVGKQFNILVPAVTKADTITINISLDQLTDTSSGKVNIWKSGN